MDTASHYLSLDALLVKVTGYPNPLIMADLGNIPEVPVIQINNRNVPSIIIVMERNVSIK